MPCRAANSLARSIASSSHASKERLSKFQCFIKSRPKVAEKREERLLHGKPGTGHHCKRSPLPRNLGNHARGQRRPTSRCQMPLFTGPPTSSRGSSPPSCGNDLVATLPAHLTQSGRTRQPRTGFTIDDKTRC